MAVDPAKTPEERLAKRLLADPRVRAIIEEFSPHGQFFVVGGAPRDILLDRSDYDLDLATSLRPDQMRQLCSHLNIRVADIGGQHQTVTLIWDRLRGPDGESAPSVEITSLRGPGMTPERSASFSDSIEEDLRYRDFTINALAVELPSGKVVDSQGAVADIKQRRIRAVGEPSTRFCEDPLRILRMVRFHSSLGFAIEERTQAAAQELFAELSRVSIERIREEFVKTLCGENVASAVVLLQRLGFFRQYIAELESCVDFEQNRFHLTELFTHTVEVVRRSPPQPVTRLAALFHDIGKPPTLSVDEAGERHFYRHEAVGAEMTKQIMERFKFSKDLTAAVSNLVALHMRPLTAGEAGLRRLLRDAAEDYPAWRALKEADALSCKIDSETVHTQLAEFDSRINIVASQPSLSPLSALAFRGEQVIALGAAKGPLVGEVLRYLHERVLDNPELNTFEQLQLLCQQYLRSRPDT